MINAEVRDGLMGSNVLASKDGCTSPLNHATGRWLQSLAACVVEPHSAECRETAPLADETGRFLCLGT